MEEFNNLFLFDDELKYLHWKVIYFGKSSLWFSRELNERVYIYEVRSMSRFGLAINFIK